MAVVVVVLKNASPRLTGLNVGDSLCCTFGFLFPFLCLFKPSLVAKISRDTWQVSLVPLQKLNLELNFQRALRQRGYHIIIFARVDVLRVDVGQLTRIR